MLDVRETWARAWPPLLAVGVVSAVGAPAAVASYRHARDVVTSTGDTVMAPVGGRASRRRARRHLGPPPSG